MFPSVQVLFLQRAYHRTFNVKYLIIESRKEYTNKYTISLETRMNNRAESELVK